MLSYKINRYGHVTVTEQETGETFYVQSDWDLPGLAMTWGWTPSHLVNQETAPDCTHGNTDGTIDCVCGLTKTDFIMSAQKWLEDHEGELAEDQGYFLGDVVK